MKRLTEYLSRSLIIICTAVALFGPRPAFADDAPPVFVDFGNFAINIPFASVNTVALWDFKAKRGLAGAETPLCSYKSISFTGGAVTSLDGQGSPFVGFHIALANPLENFAPLSHLHPGIFGGRNFHQNAYMLGLKLSTPLW